MAGPLTVAVAGCGSRGQDTYARILARMPERARVVAAADIDPEKLAGMRALCDLSEAQCYASAEELLSRPRLADVLVIATPDRCHYAQARAALTLDYHLLLEKPIATEAEHCLELAALARARGRQVVVCHVLRYTPFYRQIKDVIDAGELGESVSLQGIERVGYWHQAHSFVRGNWRNQAESSFMLLQKCCHDMDLLLWLTGKRAAAVSSFGSLTHFRASQAPAGAAERCVDCPVADCPYNAVAFYLSSYRKSGDAWPQNVVAFQPDEEKLLAALRNGPYDRCVYRCDNDVVDHQVVSLAFTDGATADYTMCAFTAQTGRTLRVMGTRGELYGDLYANRIQVTPFGGAGREIDVARLAQNFSGHAGGDARMIDELLALLSGQTPQGSALTSIGRSVESHLLAFAAERSRLAGGKAVTLSPDPTGAEKY